MRLETLRAIEIRSVAVMPHEIRAPSHSKLQSGLRMNLEQGFEIRAVAPDAIRKLITSVPCLQLGESSRRERYVAGPEISSDVVQSRLEGVHRNRSASGGDSRGIAEHQCQAAIADDPVRRTNAVIYVASRSIGADSPAEYTAPAEIVAAPEQRFSLPKLAIHIPGAKFVSRTEMYRGLAAPGLVDESIAVRDVAESRRNGCAVFQFHLVHQLLGPSVVGKTFVQPPGD